MDEEELEQTQTGSDESSDDTLDSLLGGETGDESSAKEQLPAEDASKEEKKHRDFEKAFYKEKEENKRLKAEKKEIPASETGTDEERGLALLRQVVSEALEPHLGSLKEQNEKQVMADFKQKQYVDVLGERIMDEYKDIPKTGNLARDLETARKAAIGNNIDLIVSTALEVGKSEGFRNRDFKRNLGTNRQTPRGGGSAESVLFERYNNGELSAKEIAEHQDEIDEWEAEQLGVNRVYN